jgi:hypothetical protein
VSEEKRLPASGQACVFCKRTIRKGSEKAEFLWMRPGDKEDCLCGRPACKVGFNDE